VKDEQSLNPSCVVSGYANTNDAFHQTASSPEGRGSFGAMTKALAMADLSPGKLTISISTVRVL
jgi:3-oxoacyl-[acyl-carrier-protein] synthase-1